MTEMDVPRPIRILVADDDQVLNHEIEVRLTQAGFLPVPVFDGNAAIEKLSEPFDLIVLDLIMPGVSGFEVLKEIQTRKIGTPVIVLSTLRQEEDVKRAEGLGAKECLSKASASFMDDIVKYAEQLSEA